LVVWAAAGLNRAAAMRARGRRSAFRIELL
jgi:hypothetical protein